MGSYVNSSKGVLALQLSEAVIHDGAQGMLKAEDH